MKQTNIFITEPDMERLRRLLDSAKTSMTDREHLAMLEEELDRVRLEVGSDASHPKHLVRDRQLPRHEIVAPTARAAHALRFQQEGFAAAESLLHVPALIDVREQDVPTDD